MKPRIRTLFFAGALLATQLSRFTADASPLRILFLGDHTTNTTRHAHALMRDLGRDAIWFDFTADPEVATTEWIAKFDAVLLDAPAAAFPALTGAGPKVVTLDFGGEEAKWVAITKAQLVAAASVERRKQWVDFLAQR